MKTHNLKIILPHGATGSSPHDTMLDSFLRNVAWKYADWPRVPVDQARQYGADVRTDKFVMHPFCWCEKPDCPYCLEDELIISEDMIQRFGNDLDNDRTAPNFWYKPLDYKVWWYKYIGRSVKVNKILSADEFAGMVRDLLG